LRSRLKQNNQSSIKVVEIDDYIKQYLTWVDDMFTKEKVNNIKITLSLIALCVPLFANHSAMIENSCPYETYVRVDGKCLDISQEGLSNITEELNRNNNSVTEVSTEVKELSQELEKLCGLGQPETTSQIEIMADVCQY
jgi:predicted transcriptional regulator